MATGPARPSVRAGSVGCGRPPRELADVSVRGYEVHIPPLFASPGLKGYVARKEPSVPLKDYLRKSPPLPKPERKMVNVELPPRDEAYCQKPSAWRVPFLSEADRLEMECNDPETNWDQWREFMHKADWGKSQHRRKMSSRIGRQKHNAWKPMIVVAKTTPGISPGVRAFRDIKV